MRMLGFSRYAFSIGLASALLAGCGGSQLPGATSPSGRAQFGPVHHMVFVYTGKKQTFKVPTGVTRIRVIAVGGDGGGSAVGHGGRVTAVIPVTPSRRWQSTSAGRVRRPAADSMAAARWHRKPAAMAAAALQMFERTAIR